ncbi:hypothetical protein JCM3770_004986 [Rhodotorula araucariae]
MHTRCCYAPPRAPSSACTAPSSPQLGTILYSGPVPPTKGLWYGVEWDDPVRGRHSGVYEKTGERFFETRVEGAGTFLRPDVSGLEVTGQTFLEALRSKYLEDTDDLAPGSDSPAPTGPAEASSNTRRISTNGNFYVEVVLTSKVRERFHQLGRLREVGLEWQGVSCATREAVDAQDRAQAESALMELGGRLDKLETLNLSFSLLPSLQEAEQIANVLHKLQNLLLNSNRFRRIVTPTALPGFEQLRRLELNNTLMSWDEIRLTSPSLPNLEELQFGYNRLRSLRATSSAAATAKDRWTILPRLTRLNLEANQLDDWPALVEELSCLPTLAELVLTNNRISSLELAASSPAAATDPSPTPHSLPHLRHLSLTDNCLSAWSTSVDALASSAPSALPSLAGLRLSGNPLLASILSATPALDAIPAPVDLNCPSSFLPTDTLNRATPYSRLLLIARLPFVTELEGTPVSSSERIDAERFWLEQLAKEDGAEAGLSESARARVRVLREKHGNADAEQRGAPGGTPQTPGGKPQTRTLNDRLIHLHIRPPACLPPPWAAPLTLTVLPTLRTLLFRTQLARLLGTPLPKPRFRLVAVLQPAEGEKGEVRVEIPQAQEGKEISCWGLGDGDTVEVVHVE